ncbi:hypothetical protein CTI12_AA600490 [Artemisia annua]|uniref:Uncharacterized protein n=1 Tax=Artemisia annua TaxID=35608 RepID=A0A2U1KI07_ARTAN|nr:hypothetical protein CTI12_AA600490 [Artemisia annua]
MEYQCVMCPFDKCSEDCPILDVLPYKEPVAEENIKKARKLVASGRKVEEIKESLRVLGNDVAAKNELINKWIEEYESKEKDPLYYLIRNRTIIRKQKKILAKGQKMVEFANDVLDQSRAIYEAAKYEEAVAAIADVDGLLGLK